MVSHAIGRPRSAIVTLLISLAAALAMCSVPLLGIHGAESALLLGILLPPMAAYVAAQSTRRARANAEPLWRVFQTSIGFALLLWACPIFVLWLDALRVRNCSPLEGFVFMLLGPGFGVLFAAVVGLTFGLLAPRWRGLPLMAAGVPIATMLLALLRFYTGPSIFAYGHFYGFFPGTLYDETINLTSAFLWLRVGTALWIIGICLALVSCCDSDTLQLSLWPMRERRLAFSTALVCLSLALFGEAYSDELGHTSSSAHVQRVLGGKLESRRCRVYFPREWAQRDRQRLREDCDFRVGEAEKWLGLRQRGLVDVYLFRSPSEKYALMGAEGTNIAKPWRSEVFISENGWPNPVLGHEIVHVVARGTGRGPLRISGALGGLWPNPALIEGVATAAAWQASGGLTPHEWAHAMLELGMIPKLSELFGAGFLGQQRRLAYTLSGSLLRFVRDRWGSAAIRATYASGNLETGVGLPLAQIEAAWQSALRAQPLAASALALARARFSGGGILSALCPHTLAKLKDGLRADMGAGDDLTAVTTCQQILKLDPSDAGTRAALGSLRARKPDLAGAQAELSQLEREHAPSPYLASIKHALADQALRDAQYARALTLYGELLAEPIDDDQRRLLQVKSLACRAALQDRAHTDGAVGEHGAGVRQAELLFQLLVGNPGERADGASAVYLTRELRTLRTDGLPQYLEGRQLFFAGRYEYAASLFDTALRLTLPSAELSAEALRVAGISRLALRQLDLAAPLFAAYGRSGSAARESEAADFSARIRFLHRSTAAH
jgi:tetratricopeptide (TPR) repeat protein